MLIHFCSPPYADIVAKYQKIFSTLFAQIVQPPKNLDGHFIEQMSSYLCSVYRQFRLCITALQATRASGKAHTPYS
jgi:hypothetical protein